MSPIIRKWGMRGTAALSVAAIAFMGTGLTLAAFGQGIDADVLSPKSWLEWSDKYGFPLVILVLFILLSTWAVRAVWGFLKPLIEAEFVERRLTAKKQGEFADNANMLLQQSVARDKDAAIKIDDLHEKVTDMHVNGVIVKRAV